MNKWFVILIQVCILTKLFIHFKSNLCHNKKIVIFLFFLINYNNFSQNLFLQELSLTMHVSKISLRDAIIKYF